MLGTRVVQAIFPRGVKRRVANLVLMLSKEEDHLSWNRAVVGILMDDFSPGFSSIYTLLDYLSI